MHHRLNINNLYCFKDKSVAFKIFELGLKRFNNSPEYILAYLGKIFNWYLN